MENLMLGRMGRESGIKFVLEFGKDMDLGGYWYCLEEMVHYRWRNDEDI